MHVALGLVLMHDARLLLAQEQTAPEPYFCNGYRPVNGSLENGSWDSVGARPGLVLEDSCPDNYAFMALKLPVGRPRKGAQINPIGRCCRLPDGVLTTEHVYALEQCPADYVATGARAEKHPQSNCLDKQGFEECMREWESMNHYLRCTKVNTTRFRTGEASEGLLVGMGGAGIFAPPGAPKETSRSRIPLGIRYGLTWSHPFGLDSASIVGYPWGSLVVGKKSKRNILFAPIIIVGEGRDLEQGTVLKTYPDCISVSDPIAPLGTCITRAQLKK